MRGLGASGYYRERRERGPDEEKRRENAWRRNRLIIFLAVAAIGFFLVWNASRAPQGAPGANLALSQEPGTVPSTSPGAQVSNQGFPATGTASPSPGQPGAGQEGSGASGAEKAIVLNATSGPYNYSVGQTMLSVWKKLFVQGGNYTESLDVSNIGNETANFNIIDVIPKSMGTSVWDAGFSENFDALSARIARFPYSLYPGETLTHGPTTLSAGNSTDAIQNLITDASQPPEGSPLLDEQWIENHPLALGQDVQQEARDSINQSGLQDWSEYDLAAVSEEISDYHEASRSIARQLGLVDAGDANGANGIFSCKRAKPIDYSKLKIIRLKASEKTRQARFSIPLDNFSSDSFSKPVFSINGEIFDHINGQWKQDSCGLNITLGLSGNPLKCGRYQFDKLSGTFKLYFPKTRAVVDVPIEINVVHEDLSAGEQIMLTNCSAANGIISTAVGKLGQMPGDFGCPNPGCACFASKVYQDGGAGIGYSAMAPTVFELAKAKGKVIDNFADLQPGDLVFYTGTYCCFPPGTITHVEIFLGGKYGASATIGSGAEPVSIHKNGLKGYFYKGVRVVNCDGGNAAGQEPVPEQKNCTAGNASTAPQSTAGAGACYADLVRATAAKQGLDPCLLIAIMKTESGCNKNAVGGSGECGLMQVMPQWFQNHAGWSGGNGILPYNYYSSPNFDDPKSCYVPANNIEAGASVFKRSWTGSPQPSLCKYNSGSASASCAYSSRVMANYKPNC